MNNEQMEQFKAAKRAGLNPKWYYHDFESGKDVIEYDIPKLLRVARIARELDDKGMIIHVPKVMGTHDTTTPYLEFRYALQEAEHLLGVDK